MPRTYIPVTLRKDRAEYLAAHPDAGVEHVAELFPLRHPVVKRAKRKAARVKRAVKRLGHTRGAKRAERTPSVPVAEPTPYRSLLDRLIALECLYNDLASFVGANIE